jgi:hypothetical protein
MRSRLAASMHQRLGIYPCIELHRRGNFGVPQQFLEDWWHDPPKPSEAKRLPKVVATGELRSRHGLAVGAGFSSLADHDSGLLADRQDLPPD